MARKNILYFSRNFPPERNRVELGPRAKFCSTPYSLFIANVPYRVCSLPPFRASLFKNVVTYEGCCGWRSIIGWGEWLRIAWGTGVFVLLICQTVWHRVKRVCIRWDHSATNPLRKIFHLLPYVSHEIIRAPAPLEHDRKSGYPLQVHRHCCFRTDGVATYFGWGVAKAFGS